MLHGRQIARARDSDLPLRPQLHHVARAPALRLCYTNPWGGPIARPSKLCPPGRVRRVWSPTKTRYGRCLFGRRFVANTNANGEHQNLSWMPSQGMSIRILECQTHKYQTQFIAESRLFAPRDT